MICANFTNVLECRFKTICLIYFSQSIALIVAFVACVSSVYAEDDASNKRSGLLQRRNIGRPSPLAKATSTTPEPAQEAEYDVSCLVSRLF